MPTTLAYWAKWQMGSLARSRLQTCVKWYRPRYAISIETDANERLSIPATASVRSTSTAYSSQIAHNWSWTPLKVYLLVVSSMF
jgi:hypothetical protein